MEQTSPPLFFSGDISPKYEKKKNLKKSDFGGFQLPELRKIN